MATVKREVEFKEYEVNGKTVKLPILNEASMTAQMRRKTRGMKEESAGEELFWLMVEATLTEEELEVLDNLTMAELGELTEKFTEEEDAEKK